MGRVFTSSKCILSAFNLAFQVFSRKSEILSHFPGIFQLGDVSQVFSQFPGIFQVPSNPVMCTDIRRCNASQQIKQASVGGIGAASYNTTAFVYGRIQGFVCVLIVPRQKKHTQQLLKMIELEQLNTKLVENHPNAMMSTSGGCCCGQG